MAVAKYLNKEGLEKVIKTLRKEMNRLYVDKGSVETLDDLPSTVMVGWVYNIKTAFETTADFVEGAGHKHTANTNIVVVDTAAAGATPVLKWDVLEGNMDDYQTKKLEEALDVLTSAKSVATSTALPTTAGTGSNAMQLYDVYFVEDTEKLYRAIAINEDDGTVTWSNIGDQTTVEGALKFLGEVTPNTPITNEEIDEIFANA